MAKKKMVKRKEIKESYPTSLAYVTLIVFLLALLIIPMINVGQGFNKNIFTGHATVEQNIPLYTQFGNYFKEAFGIGGDANPDLMISKYFLLFLIVIFLKSMMSVANFPPTVENKANLYQWLMAIPMAVLAIMFITPADLYGVLNTYSALGLTLTIFLPFAVVIMYTVGSLTSKKKITVQNIILSNFMWLLFAGFLMYRVIILFFVEKAHLSSAVMLISIIAAILALIITLKFKAFSKYIVRMSGFGKEIEATLAAKTEQVNRILDKNSDFLRKVGESYEDESARGIKRMFKNITGN